MGVEFRREKKKKKHVVPEKMEECVIYSEEANYWEKMRGQGFGNYEVMEDTVLHDVAVSSMVRFFSKAPKIMKCLMWVSIYWDCPYCNKWVDDTEKQEVS